MHLDYLSAVQILDKSSILHSEEKISRRIQELAHQIESEIINDIPLFLSVMNGALFFSAALLKHMGAPFTLDYIHASRYGNDTYGASHVTWHHQPNADKIRGRNVYILDDILDEGYTLAEIKRYINSSGAKSCKIAVLIDKNIDKPKPVTADYIGLSAPNQFLFGCGMDIYGLYRQLPYVCIYNN
ncbi:MAG: hypoxanthine-guanine phosphoribosyltransferase [Burkholderiales bacterium]|nr:hypoxanthine-guanine phosphoribosyltransferase [Burkholderiales bacterium]